MDFNELKKAFAERELFEGKTWRTSPEPWKLSGEIVDASGPRGSVPVIVSSDSCVPSSRVGSSSRARPGGRRGPTSPETSPAQG